MAKDLKLKEGDVAPAFSAATGGGGRVSLADFKGKNVVLYFYPRDDTPGCTKEACAFRDHFAGFQKRGAVVLGVSTDSAKSHDKFAGKFKLPFTLLADEDKRIVKLTAYGARKVSWAENTRTISRDIFNRTGWPNKKYLAHGQAGGASAEVLAAL